MGWTNPFFWKGAKKCKLCREANLYYVIYGVMDDRIQKKPERWYVYCHF